VSLRYVPGTDQSTKLVIRSLRFHELKSPAMGTRRKTRPRCGAIICEPVLIPQDYARARKGTTAGFAGPLQFQPPRLGACAKELCWAFLNRDAYCCFITRTAKSQVSFCHGARLGRRVKFRRRQKYCMRLQIQSHRSRRFLCRNVFHDRILVRRIFMNNSKVPSPVEANA